MRATWPAQTLPKLPEGTVKQTFSVVLDASVRLEVAGKVIDHLRQQARPVDRIDRADLVLALELQVVGDGLDHVLAVVEHALDGDVVDVGVQQAEHLRLLERAHAPVRAGHEDAHALLAAHGVFGRAAGVAAGGAQDVELFAAARQFVLEQVAQQLHRHVLEGQRGAVGQGFEVEAGLPAASAARSRACRRPPRCRSCRRSRAGRRRECRRCRATAPRTPARRSRGCRGSRASAAAWPRRPADRRSGRYRPPSGARPSSRISQKCLRSGSPRVDRYCIRSALPCGCARSAPARWASACSWASTSFMVPSRVSCVRMIRSVEVAPSPPTSSASRCSTASMLMPASASDAGHLGQHAGLVGHAQAQVVAGHHLAHGQHRQVAHAQSGWKARCGTRFCGSAVCRRVMSTRSAITALAVGSLPAPLP